MPSVFHRCNGFIRNLTSMVIMTIAVVLAPLLLLAEQPAKVHQDLLSVSFPTERDGWASGRWGTVLHTADGGKTWISQTSGTDYTLAGIHFVDALNGCAVGDQGMIIHTNDGGATWVKQKSPVPYYLMAVQFVTPDKGWIVTEQTTILATDDGGANWQVQFTDQDFILRSLSFCDEQNGWAVGEYGYTYRTDNGGQTWRQQAGEYTLSTQTMSMVGGNFLFDVIAVNPKTAWVAGIDGYVARTDDGGETWTFVTEGIPKRHLFAVAKDSQDALYIGGDALLLRKDAASSGFSTVKVIPSITYGWLYRIVARGAAGLVAVGKDGWIYVSDNHGADWQKVRY